jgi:wyosine [tRNA(Phe)-imidazoG37] synthetase (radical SAM superfamily)
VGVTKKQVINRSAFYEPSVIYSEVKKHIEKSQPDDMPDFLTFVSNGEPTLDINLGSTIQQLKQLNIPIAVITNASLLYNKQVRDDLNLANYVSVKIDAGIEETWKKINRPINRLSFNQYMDGLKIFSTQFGGKLISETMLIKGINDDKENMTKTAKLVSEVQPTIAYISTPTRPPAISSAISPNEQVVNEAYQVFDNCNLNTELLVGFEGTYTGVTGNAYEDIVNICSVHPIREDTMQELLRKNNADHSILTSLLQNKYIQKAEYNSNVYYLRKFRE